MSAAPPYQNSNFSAGHKLTAENGMPAAPLTRAPRTVTTGSRSPTYNPRSRAQIPARRKMILAKKTKTMRKKLRKISKQRKSFTFAENTISQEPQSFDPRETTSIVNEVFGRDEEKKIITDCLSASHRKDGTVILPIYGLGGIGKSTMAQLVYNYNKLKQYYDHRVWVYVSQEFDLKKIGTSIISRLSTAGGEQNTNSLQLIQQRLNDMPRGKILIILDDIWEEDDFKLKDMEDMLNKKGSMVDVIVTTRSESIAKKNCTVESYKLQPLKNDVCWDIIKRYSGFNNKSNKGELEQIGLEIAKKCGGVALAAQALGYTLRSKDLHGWLEMNNSDIWKESFGDDDPQHMKVLTSLMLSYERMLRVLKLCFSYCAIFPKGHDIFEDDLVHEWIALDFIKKSSEGKEYIKQLLGMSFLQNSKLPSMFQTYQGRWYTMHDLVHDLATSVIGDELTVIDAAKESNNASKHKYCRECSGITLTSPIGQLNQLRCLIAPQVQNVMLPESIAQLLKLQYLNLQRSSQMSALPNSIGKLSALVDEAEDLAFRQAVKRTEERRQEFVASMARRVLVQAAAPGTNVKLQDRG
ncbi:hypothetical protein PR202_ga28648 [Eleusine coracana subsp. coracana]|uniref:NB-ARC domain-containing protein n=1 Tax=Eleusine coracana subsp. coracana TaxID=191504 RepID=A0AAV5DJ51_ELECO|nr:hypothetical protein PR202_ga28648 [Eleusine coracana subsp. coracana]